MHTLQFSTPLQYLIALLAVGCAVLLRQLLDPWMGDYLPLSALYGAVALSLWVGGYRPAMLAVVLGYLACDWLFIQPRGSIDLRTPAEIAGAAVYLVSCSMIVGLGHSMRTSRERAERESAERVKAEQAAQASTLEQTRQRQFLETLLDNASVCVAVMAGRELRYTFVNRAYQALQPDVPMIGRTYREVFPSVVETGVEEMRRKVLETGQPRHDHGVAIPIPGVPDAAWDQHVVPLPRAPDEVPTLLVMTWNVTERERAARALQESRERFNQLADAMPQLVWTATPDGTLDYYNARRADYDNDTAHANEWALMVHPDELLPTRDAWRRATSSGTPYEMENRIRLADGTYRWHLTRALPVRGANGRIAKWFGTATDIDRLKRAEGALSETSASLRHERKRLELALRAGGMGVYEWRVGADEMWWSPELYGIYGVDPASFTPRLEAFVTLVHPEDLTELCRKTQEAMGRGGVFTHEYRVMRPDGAIRWVANRSHVSTDGQSRAQSITGVAMDITERKRAEQALLEADRRKDEFIATLAHELRNPLAPIRNAVQLLSAKGPKAPDPGWTRDVIERQVAHMARLLDDLLDISRISRNRVELQVARVSFAAVLELAIETSRPLIERAQHTLTVRVPDEPLWLNADAVRLAQVFSNLLNNAAKYTEHGGAIHLIAERHANELCVTVRDTGIGIASEMLPRVFDMFSQAAPALERSQGGLGIGLALARGLIDAMGGRLEAHSEGLGKGSEFRVYLPLAPHFDEQDRDASRASGVRDGARVGRLLIADDLVESADSLALILQMEGHEVHTAYDGEEAVRKAEALRPDIVLLDIGMPKLNGYEACERIRRHDWGRGMHLIALTGWGQEDARSRMQAVGFDGHLLKPVAGDVLNAAIEAALAQRTERGSTAAQGTDQVDDVAARNAGP